MQGKAVPLVEGPVRLDGAVSVEVTSQGVKPWRVPHHERDLFDANLVRRAEQPSGVRLRFASDTSRLLLRVKPVSGRVWGEWTFDLFVDDRMHQRRTLSCTESRVGFAGWDAGEHVFEIYLPHQYVTVTLVSLTVDERSEVWQADDDRPKWVVFGSTITHGAGAEGPSETWPALVAQRFGLSFTNLGYAGQEHIEPMVARMIRELPADYLSVAVGISSKDCVGNWPQQMRSSLVGLLRIIREGHPRTPIALTSAIFCPDHEMTPSERGAIMRTIRKNVEEAASDLHRHGDEGVHFVDGLELFGHEYAQYLVDGAHPDAEGYRLLADRYAEVVMPQLGLKPVQQNR